MSGNPYQYNAPLSATGYFAGRQEAFAFIQRNLVGGQQQSALVILGKSQIGKSSFLRRLPDHIDSHYCPIRLSLRAGTVAGEQAWLSALGETVQEALQVLNIRSARLPDLPVPADELREALLGEYMQEGLRSLRLDRHLLLLIDNADRLLTAVQQRSLPRDTFDFLAKLLETHPRLDIVMAFDSRFETDILSKGRPFATELTFRLSELTPDEVNALLTEPLEGKIAYEPEALDAVFELTNGHPYLTQLVGWLLYERLDELGRGGPISVLDVNAVAEAALAIAGDALSAVWEHGSASEKLVLTALSVLSPEDQAEPVPHDDIGAWLIAADHEMDPRTVNATWRRLEYEGVLSLTSEGKLVINGGLQRRWLRDHVTLPTSSAHGVSRRRVGVFIAAALVVLALLLGILNNLPGPSTTEENGSEATITLDLDLMATSEAYDATQTAAAP